MSRSPFCRCYQPFPIPWLMNTVPHPKRFLLPPRNSPCWMDRPLTAQLHVSWPITSLVRPKSSTFSLDSAWWKLSSSPMSLNIIFIVQERWGARCAPRPQRRQNLLEWPSIQRVWRYLFYLCLCLSTIRQKGDVTAKNIAIPPLPLSISVPVPVSLSLLTWTTTTTTSCLFLFLFFWLPISFLCVFPSVTFACITTKTGTTTHQQQ